MSVGAEDGETFNQECIVWEAWTNRKTQYGMKWEGYDHTENTIELEDNVHPDPIKEWIPKRESGAGQSKKELGVGKWMTWRRKNGFGQITYIIGPGGQRIGSLKKHTLWPLVKTPKAKKKTTRKKQGARASRRSGKGSGKGRGRTAGTKKKQKKEKKKEDEEEDSEESDGEDPDKQSEEQKMKKKKNKLTTKHRLAQPVEEFGGAIGGGDGVSMMEQSERTASRNGNAIRSLAGAGSGPTGADMKNDGTTAEGNSEEVDEDVDIEHGGAIRSIAGSGSGKEPADAEEKNRRRRMKRQQCCHPGKSRTRKSKQETRLCWWNWTWQAPTEEELSTAERSE